jgi:capsid portal protein
MDKPIQQGLGLQTVKIASRVPSITDPESLIKSLTALNVMGALTPRTANETANRILQIELPEYPKVGEEGYEEWMDKPILFVTRGVKSQDGQESKDEGTKGVEKDGDVGAKQPEHGDE